MTAYLFSFSAASRAMACRASCVLPSADHLSEDAEAGTIMHAFLHRVGELRAGGTSAEEARETAAMEAPEDEQPFLLSIPVEELPTDGAFVGEVALAFDAATGKARELGRNLGRRYAEAATAQGQPLRSTEIVGSIDVASLMGSDGVFVADWKRRGLHVAPVRENWQIKAGIVAACAAWGRNQARGEIIRIYDDGREPYRDRADLSRAEVQAAQVALTQLAARILLDRKAHALGQALPATTGPHCRYCPSFQWCPANATLARRVALAEDFREALTDTPLITRENAPAIRERIVQAKAVIDAVESALDALASQEAAAGRPIQLREGVYYQPVPRPRDAIDGAKAAPILRAELGEAAEVAIEVDVSKAGIKKALRRKLGSSKGITKEDERIVEMLRRAGAIKRTVSYSCDEVRAKAEPKQIDIPKPEAA